MPCQHWWTTPATTARLTDSNSSFWSCSNNFKTLRATCKARAQMALPFLQHKGLCVLVCGAAASHVQWRMASTIQVDFTLQLATAVVHGTPRCRHMVTHRIFSHKGFVLQLDSFLKPGQDGICLWSGQTECCVLRCCGRTDATGRAPSQIRGLLPM